MSRDKKLNGPCAIEICKRKSLAWKAVTAFVLSKGANNRALPSYIMGDDTICLDCYNAIITNVFFEFQQHALEWQRHY
ncbi:329_t:CDS:1, partial [Cetraspora pellucida]